MDPVSALPVDQVKYLNDTHVQIQATVNKALLEKISYLKSLISHEFINPTYEELLKLALDAAIEKVEKKKGIYSKPSIDGKKSQEIIRNAKDTSHRQRQGDETCSRPTPSTEQERLAQTPENQTHNLTQSNPETRDLKTSNGTESSSSELKVVTLKTKPTTQSFAVGTSRYISRSVRKFSLNRAHHQCEYVHSSGERCTSKFQLQFDHIKAFSKGGSPSHSNIQVLCRVHNNYKSDS